MFGRYSCLLWVQQELYIVRDCPHVRNQARIDAQPRPNPNVIAEPFKRKRFYVFIGREEQMKLADVDNSNLLVFSFPFYALLDQISTLSFFTHLVASKFDLLPEILHEMFVVSATIRDTVRVEGVCRETDGIVASPFDIKWGVIRFSIIRITRCYLTG